jgi:hypothetical protein
MKTIIEHYNSYSKVTKTLIITSLTFLVYGYLCRIVGLNFFWESKSIGWMFFWLSIIFIFSNIINFKKLAKLDTLAEKIGLAVSIFVIIIKSILFFVMQQTSAFDNATKFIKKTKKIQTEIGIINNVSIIPFGGVEMSTNSKGSAGQADLYFIVKGSKKYIDLNLVMNKDFETEWQI